MENIFEAEAVERLKKRINNLKADTLPAWGKMNAYKRNSPTAPVFKITEAKDFEKERDRLIAHIDKIASLGARYFDNRPSNPFGPLKASEWNVLFSKHLEHHLTQFGV